MFRRISNTFSNWAHESEDIWSRRPGAGAAAWTLAIGLIIILAFSTRRPIHLDEVEAQFARVLPPVEMRIDVNRASAAELQNLPRIGPSLADAIVRDREANGPFATTSDLARVRGIGPRTIRLLRPHVLPTGSTSGPETTSSSREP